MRSLLLRSNGWMNWDEEEALVDFQRAAGVLRNLKHPAAQEKTMAAIDVGFIYGYLGRYDESVQMFECALRDR
ncbi:hypothetical protein BDV12DRAFT_160861 [Aspergillus spectabilis]